MSSSDKYQRYQRQILLKEFGEIAQEKLLNAKVLVIGAGGLGCPALQYLAAAGIGCIGIVDFDVVDISNLHRQILYTVDDIGKSKAETAAKKLNALNPEIKINTFNFQITAVNALEIISFYDLVIDGSDNFSTRYLVNDACVLLDKPLVYGAVLRFEGQVGVFNLMDNESKIKTNYRDLFPEPPDPSSTLSCNEAGVIGILPGIIGTMQASEAIKIISGVGKPLCNKIISYNALRNTFYDFEVSPAIMEHRAVPKSESEFILFNYNWFCNSHATIAEISVDEFNEMRTNEKITIIDVREKGELPLVDEFPFTLIPLSKFEKSVSTISSENKIVIYCKGGVRSAKALKILNKTFPDYIAYSLTGGIEAWKKNNHKILI